MKTKILLTATILVLSVSAFAQIGRPSFGLRAGINFQNLNGKDADDDRLENNLMVGFNLGVNAEVPVAEDFYVQPGLLYSVKGAGVETSLSDEVKFKINYIELPINLVYKPVLGEGRLLMGFGPYLAYALNGKAKSDADEVDIEFENEISASEAVTDGPFLKRFDAGANLLFGYEINNRLSAQLNAQLGLLNLQPKIAGTNIDPGTLKNTGFGVSLGYRF